MASKPVNNLRLKIGRVLLRLIGAGVRIRFQAILEGTEPKTIY